MYTPSYVSIPVDGYTASSNGYNRYQGLYDQSSKIRHYNELLYGTSSSTRVYDEATSRARIYESPVVMYDEPVTRRYSESARSSSPPVFDQCMQKLGYDYESYQPRSVRSRSQPPRATDWRASAEYSPPKRAASITRGWDWESEFPLTAQYAARSSARSVEPLDLYRTVMAPSSGASHLYPELAATEFRKSRSLSEPVLSDSKIRPDSSYRKRDIPAPPSPSRSPTRKATASISNWEPVEVPRAVTPLARSKARSSAQSKRSMRGSSTASLMDDVVSLESISLAEKPFYRRLSRPDEYFPSPAKDQRGRSTKPRIYQSSNNNVQSPAPMPQSFYEYGQMDKPYRISSPQGRAPSPPRAASPIPRARSAPPKAYPDPRIRRVSSPRKGSPRKYMDTHDLYHTARSSQSRDVYQYQPQQSKTKRIARTSTTRSPPKARKGDERPMFLVRHCPENVLEKQPPPLLELPNMNHKAYLNGYGIYSGHRNVLAFDKNGAQYSPVSHSVISPRASPTRNRSPIRGSPTRSRSPRSGSPRRSTSTARSKSAPAKRGKTTSKTTKQPAKLPFYMTYNTQDFEEKKTLPPPKPPVPRFPKKAQPKPQPVPSESTNSFAHSGAITNSSPPVNEEAYEARASSTREYKSPPRAASVTREYTSPRAPSVTREYTSPRAPSVTREYTSPSQVVADPMDMAHEGHAEEEAGEHIVAHGQVDEHVGDSVVIEEEPEIASRGAAKGIDGEAAAISISQIDAETMDHDFGQVSLGNAIVGTVIDNGTFAQPISPSTSTPKKIEEVSELEAERKRRIDEILARHTAKFDDSVGAPEASGSGIRSPPLPPPTHEDAATHNATMATVSTVETASTKTGGSDRARAILAKRKQQMYDNTADSEDEDEDEE